MDLSRINGTEIGVGYPQRGSARTIVDAIQTTFESYAHRRENFGRHLKRKLGQDFTVSEVIGYLSR